MVEAYSRTTTLFQAICESRWTTADWQTLLSLRLNLTVFHSDLSKLAQYVVSHSYSCFQAQIPLGASRHDTTRYKAHAFDTGKSRAMLSRHARHDKHDSYDTWCSGAYSHSAGWGEHVHLTLSRSCSWDWCKSRAQRTKLVHASTTDSSSSAMLEQGATRTTCATSSSRRARHAQHVVRVVSWRNKWNLEFISSDYIIWWLVWRSDSGVGHINKVKQRRARLILRLVIFDGSTISAFILAT